MVKGSKVPKFQGSKVLGRSLSEAEVIALELWNLELWNPGIL